MSITKRWKFLTTMTITVHGPEGSSVTAYEEITYWKTTPEGELVLRREDVGLLCLWARGSWSRFEVSNVKEKVTYLDEI